MSIKNKIVIKKPVVQDKKEELYEQDRPRYEEHDDEEYREHCRKFFKGKVE